MSLGVLFRIIRGVKRTVELPEAIDRLEAFVERHPARQYTGTERFHIVLTLENAKLHQRLQADGLTARRRLQLQQEYLNRIEEEFEMAEKDLEQEQATRAEVTALGLALKELALTLQGEMNRARRLLWVQLVAVAGFVLVASVILECAKERYGPVSSWFQRSGSASQ
jgi:hypothetical protein